MNKKSIYIINTGGTISMSQGKNGYEPTPGLVKKYLQNNPEFNANDMPNFDVYAMDPLIDSSNMTVKNWNEIANHIAKVYDQYDGFVILHGTDTLAYTASILSFMLEGLQKPVIVTGSQIPLIETLNDARRNLLCALLFASKFNMPEVMVCFNNQLYRGNRTSKTDASGFSAFSSPNFLPLGQVGTEMEIAEHLLFRQTTSKLKLQHISETKIAYIRLFPGILDSVLHNLLDKPLDALIIETYGAGNAPTEHKALMNTLKQAQQQNVITINTSQCAKGRVRMGRYAASSSLQSIGAIGSNDMTSEAVLTKVYYLFSCGLTKEEIKIKFIENLRGEISEIK